jgi:hypothetical protein
VVLDDSELVPLDAEAAGRTVVPLHEHLQLVCVMDGAAPPRARPRDLDAITDLRELVVPVSASDTESLLTHCLGNAQVALGPVVGASFLTDP